MTDIPKDFSRLKVGGEFIALNGPLYFSEREAEFWVGFRVESRHTNPLGTCHGGMLATFCDMFMPISVTRTVPELHGHFLPTISLQIDFMAPAPTGAWVEGRATALRITRKMVFANGLVYANGELAVRASGIFKKGPSWQELQARNS